MFASELSIDSYCEHGSAGLKQTQSDGVQTAEPVVADSATEDREADTNAQSNGRPFAAQRVHQLLRRRLDQLQETSNVFHDSTQANTTLAIVFDDLLPRYQRQHAELIFGHTPGFVFNSFFIARAIETVLRVINASGSVPLETQNSLAIADAAFEKFNNCLLYTSDAADE